MKYKYWSTEKLEKLYKELKWRMNHTSVGVNDILLFHAIEDLLDQRLAP